MPIPLRSILAALMLAPLAACSSFGGGEEPVAAVEAKPAVEPVEAVGSIEVGRTRDGIVVTAYGIAPGLGYSSPRLAERRGGRIGTDGFLDFDFVADAPDRGFALPTGEPSARILRADRLIGLETVRRAAGLRIHAATGGQQVLFPGSG